MRKGKMRTRMVMTMIDFLGERGSVGIVQMVEHIFPVRQQSSKVVACVPAPIEHQVTCLSIRHIVLYV